MILLTCDGSSSSFFSSSSYLALTTLNFLTSSTVSGYFSVRSIVPISWTNCARLRCDSISEFIMKCKLGLLKSYVSPWLNITLKLSSKGLCLLQMCVPRSISRPSPLRLLGDFLIDCVC